MKLTIIEVAFHCQYNLSNVLSLMSCIMTSECRGTEPIKQGIRQKQFVLNDGDSHGPMHIELALFNELSDRDCKLFMCF